MKWYAVKTRYKCEKQVCKHLSQRGIECYVPLLQRTKRYQRKVKHYEVPLINCYVFVRIDFDDRIDVLSNYNVVDFLKVGGEISPVTDEEISIMRRVVGEVTAIELTPYEWKEGDQVEVISGSLTGLTGTLLTRAGKHELLIGLETLGYQLKVGIDESLLRRIPTRVTA